MNPANWNLNWERVKLKQLEIVKERLIKKQDEINQMIIERKRRIEKLEKENNEEKK